MIDLLRDAHVHTAFSAGRDSVSVLVAAAEGAGLTEVTFADRVAPDSGWLSSYLAAIARAQQRTDLVLRRGAEVEAIGTDGWLAFPADLGGLEVISVGISRLPLPAGPVGPETVRALIAAGTIAAADVVEHLVNVICLAIERVSRYAPTLLARPLEFLARAGIGENAIDDAAIAALAAACRVHGTVVEISEGYRVPSARVARALAAAEVSLAAASDARQASDIGIWDYVCGISEQSASAVAADSPPPDQRRGGAQPLT